MPAAPSLLMVVVVGMAVGALEGLEVGCPETWLLLSRVGAAEGLGVGAAARLGAGVEGFSVVDTKVAEGAEVKVEIVTVGTSVGAVVGVGRAVAIEREKSNIDMEPSNSPDK